LAPDVATALAELGARADWVGDDDLVFVGDTGNYLDGSALRGGTSSPCLRPASASSGSTIHAIRSAPG
jgi:hypothetical protein